MMESGRYCMMYVILFIENNVFVKESILGCFIVELELSEKAFGPAHSTDLLYGRGIGIVLRHSRE